MAVISTKLGKIISNKNPSYIFDPTETEDGGIPTYTEPTTGGSRIPSSYYDALGRAAESRAASAADKVKFDIGKFITERDLNAAALARQQAGVKSQMDYFRTQLGLGIPSAISGEIEEQERAGQGFIGQQAAALLSQLQARQGEATGLTQTGFSNLQNYLAQNQPTAFAQAQRARPTITQSDLGQYMAGQGVSPAAAQEASTLANIQSAGGASNYNQLLNVLAAREAAGQQSRQSEAQMGLTSQLAQLQAIFGQQTGGLEQSRLQALAELSSRSGAARLQAQQQATARQQAIEDAIAQLVGTGLFPQGIGGGTGDGTGTGTGTDEISQGPLDLNVPRVGPSPAPRAERVETAAQEFSSFKEAIKALNPKAVAALTSDGTGLSAKEIAELKRKNPKLAAQFK